MSSDSKGDWHPFIPRSYIWLIAGVLVLGIVVKPGARWKGYRDVRLQVVAALGFVVSSTVDFVGLTELFFIACQFTFLPSLTKCSEERLAGCLLVKGLARGTWYDVLGTSSETGDINAHFSFTRCFDP